MGVTRAATTLARVAGPAFAGGLFGYLGRDWPYFAGAAIMALVMVLAWRARAQFPHNPQPALEATSSDGKSG
jgi:hypothetical protein